MSGEAGDRVIGELLSAATKENFHDNLNWLGLDEHTLK